jgi:hypothetical protein
MPELSGHFDVIDRVTPDKPYCLVAALARNFLNATFTEAPSSLRREKRPTARRHPKDCAVFSIVQGIWLNRYFDNAIGISVLTSAYPGWLNGGAVFHHKAVWIKLAGEML